MRSNKEIKIIFGTVCLLFLAFMVIPMGVILFQSVLGEEGFTLEHYIRILNSRKLGQAFINSILLALLAACTTTLLAFILAYSIHFTNIPEVCKRIIKAMAVLPMLLPTITYGFAIIYSFGKQGLLTRLLGRQLFDIYGINGLLIGYVIYTLPVSFILLNNTMSYIDKKYLIVSRIMGDTSIRSFCQAILRPMTGTLAASVIQSFSLCFTDFGIPASVGGRVEVLAGLLYNEMLGSVPDFHTGSVIALCMLVPSVVSIALLTYLERFNIRYNRISEIEMKKNCVRDVIFPGISFGILICIASVFAVMFIVPFVEEWPYQNHFTLEHVQSVLLDKTLVRVFTNSLKIAVLTAIFGSLVVYGAALVTARSTISDRCKKVMESISLITNTIPGMVLGIAFLLTFSGTELQNTITIIVCCNIIHFFSTPYLMMKSSLKKMNASWETVASLMGDTWIKTVIRVVTPNVISTLFEVFEYYFVNAMVTVSALVFITGARTMVITTKIKELQHYAKFNEIFVLSLLILLINIIAKAVFSRMKCSKHIENNRRSKVVRKRMRKLVAIVGVMVLSMTTITGCGTKKEKEVIIYSNADDEAVVAMKAALDQNGYEGKYIFQSFGTSELGGKLLAEGTNIEADLVTMSSFYLESAQEQKQMFKTLTFETNALQEYPDYYTPITSQEGAIIVNTQVMEENQLPMPVSLKDLANSEYEGFLSVTDIQGSSTAWLMIQALISEYGETGTKDILAGIYKNAGAHLESSGSGPIKKVRAGEVAIGFGLRHQAVADKESGLPIDYIDPIEGNFSLTESVAVIDKGENTNPLAMEMAECIIKEGRKDIIKSYPNPIYEGEMADEANVSAYPKVFAECLTVELLNKHKELSEQCK